MTAKRTVIYSNESPYGSYKVVDMVYNDRPARMLFGNRASPQSGAAKDGEPELLFDYNQRLIEIVMSCNPKKILVIGGGAFMLPIAIFQRFPGLTIDVVEIDPLLVTIAHDYFDLPASKRMNVHVMDGAEYIASAKGRYDMILIDAFAGFTIPPQLLDEVALKNYKRHLKRNGVVAMNFISEYKPRRYRLAHELIESFGAIFPNVSLYQADPSYPAGAEQNHLLVASNRPVHFEYLNSSEIEQHTTGVK